ncbi:LuxR family transcriptional regulator [Chania multitudinisentens RB-25]|uniref:LuxR family transcriptional regulator n=1 Tax=Chania multitudinisentens RB-25 TaxID=1441930 RepID=A0A0D4ZYL6_9GAMM|nr:response regulator transcription factor [Chania multitudinisentens]AJW28971.1 LuxR family transcriptional regulator [Chania multitudinisentens RB-25]
MSKPYALVVDDHPLVAGGIAAFLGTHCGYQQVCVATSRQECDSLIEEKGPPQLLVLDFWLADGTALQLIKNLSQKNPNIRLLVISGDENNNVQHKAREIGAHGFVHKHDSPQIFNQAVTALQNGQLWFPDASDPPSFSSPTANHQEFGLTQRQAEVLAMMLRGFSNKRIAMKLTVSEPTIKEHITGILSKLGVSNRVEAITLLQGRRFTP